MPDAQEQADIDALGDYVAKEILADEDQQETPAEESEAEATDAAPEDDQQEVEEEAKEEAEPDEEEVELADTLEGLAEQIGIDADDLRGLSATVTVNGETRQVAIGDALREYAAHDEITQQGERLNQERQQLDQNIQMATQAWNERFQRLDQAVTMAEQLLAQSRPDLDRLLAEGDTEGYLQARNEWEERQRHLNEFVRFREQQFQESQQTHAQQLQERLGREIQATVNAHPELRDPVKMREFDQQVSDTLGGYGFNAQEIEAWTQSTFDHRHIALLKDAMAHRMAKKALQSKKLKLPKKPVRKIKGGKTPEQRDTAKMRALRNRVSKKDATQDHEALSQLFAPFAD